MGDRTEPHWFWGSRSPNIQDLAITLFALIVVITVWYAVFTDNSAFDYTCAELREDVEKSEFGDYEKLREWNSAVLDEAESDGWVLNRQRSAQDAEAYYLKTCELMQINYPAANIDPESIDSIKPGRGAVIYVRNNRY